MKKIKKLSLIIIVLSFILSACTMEKRVYMSGYNILWGKGIHKSYKQGLAENKIKNEVKTRSKNNVVPVAKIEQAKTLIADKTEENNNLIASVDKSIIPINIITNKLKEFYTITTSADDCDNIILMNGEEIKAKVSEITIDEIKYKKCDNLTGPSYSIKKSEVFMIKYSNGTKEIITSNNSTPSNNNISTNNVSDKSQKNTDEKKVGVFGIVSFVLSLIGLLVECFASAGAGVAVGIIMGLLAIIFGAIGLGKKWNLKGFAIAGLVIGIIDLIVVVLALLIIAAVL